MLCATKFAGCVQEQSEKIPFLRDKNVLDIIMRKLPSKNGRTVAHRGICPQEHFKLMKLLAETI